MFAAKCAEISFDAFIRAIERKINIVFSIDIGDNLAACAFCQPINLQPGLDLFVILFSNTQSRCSRRQETISGHTNFLHNCFYASEPLMSTYTYLASKLYYKSLHKSSVYRLLSVQSCLHV